MCYHLGMELFTDGSSFIQDGQRKAGYAVMTTDEIVTAEALPQGWSAQRAEPWALIQVLRHAKGKRVNMGFSLQGIGSRHGKLSS